MGEEPGYLRRMLISLWCSGTPYHWEEFCLASLYAASANSPACEDSPTASTSMV